MKESLRWGGTRPAMLKDYAIELHRRRYVMDGKQSQVSADANNQKNTPAGYEDRVRREKQVSTGYEDQTIQNKETGSTCAE